jgi:two-component system, cell cycle response regulator DivK
MPLLAELPAVRAAPAVGRPAARHHRLCRPARLARERLPDLVVMDISIPLIDGHEATRILKADPGTASIPVLALTAHAMAEDRVRAAEAGCDGYLAKPAEPKDVVAEIRRLLASGR